MVVDQQSLLEDKDRLEELRRSYDGEARLNESFIVLTVGANDAVELEKVVFDWPDYWEQNQAPSFLVVVRSLDPKLRVTNRFRTFKTRSTADFQGSFLALNCRCRCNAST